jgi:hypothetical protein
VNYFVTRMWPASAFASEKMMSTMFEIESMRSFAMAFVTEYGPEFLSMTASCWVLTAD